MNPFVVVFGVLDVQPTKAPWQIHADTTNHHKPHLNYTVGSRLLARTAQLSAAAFGLKRACIAATCGRDQSLVYG